MHCKVILHYVVKRVLDVVRQVRSAGCSCWRRFCCGHPLPFCSKPCCFRHLAQRQLGAVDAVGAAPGRRASAGDAVRRRRGAARTARRRGRAEDARRPQRIPRRGRRRGRGARRGNGQARRRARSGDYRWQRAVARGRAARLAARAAGHSSTTSLHALQTATPEGTSAPRPHVSRSSDSMSGDTITAAQGRRVPRRCMISTTGP